VALPGPFDFFFLFSITEETLLFNFALSELIWDFETSRETRSFLIKIILMEEEIYLHYSCLKGCLRVLWSNNFLLYTNFRCMSGRVSRTDSHTCE
jgi:hypothetical protein